MDATGNAVYVQALGTAIRRTGDGFGAVPGLLREVLQSEAWREFVTPRGEVMRYERFVDFIVTPPSKGLGATVDLVRRICSDDPSALGLVDQALAGRPSDEVPPEGSEDGLANVDGASGKSRAQALRRLRAANPELHVQVLQGEKSAHRAMLEAGLRSRTATIRPDDPGAVAKTLRKQMTPEQIEQLVHELRVREE